MARMESLYCPFAPKVHSDASSVHEGSVLWARSMGMLPTEQHIRTAYKSKVGWLVARAYPTAMLHGLQLVSDWTMLFCLLDDVIEKLGTSDEVAAYLQHLLDLFRTGSAGSIEVAGSTEDPFAVGMLDLRRRLLVMAPPSHFERFVEALERLFASNVTEARNRERAQIPSVASYVALREVTIGLEVMFALAEVVEGFSLPNRIRKHPALRKLVTRACNIVGWANDLYTYEKEIIQGESHNLVLVLMNERRLTITEAVAQAVALHDNEVRSFLREIGQLPSFAMADPGVQRYVEMLGCWIRGHLDWAHETGRYRPFEEPPSEQPRRAANTAAAAANTADSSAAA